MKKNTYATKLLLQKALISVPEDFALIEVKNSIKNALSKLEHVESKREKREEKREKRESNTGQLFLNPTLALKFIEQEIEKTKANLQEIKSRKTNNLDQDSDDGLQSLLG